MKGNICRRKGAIPLLLLIVLVILALAGTGVTLWIFRKEVQDSVKWLLLFIVAITIFVNLGAAIRWFKNILDATKSKGP